MVGLDNRLLSDGVYWYEYDAEGNRTARFIDADKSQSLTTGDTEVTEYVWDVRNRLVQVKQFAEFASISGSPEQVVDYLYDTENRWIGENIDLDGDGVIDHQTRFTYDGNQIVLQFDKDGEGALTGENLSHRYLWQPDVVDQLIADEQVTSLKEPGDVLWALGDHLGTVRDLAVYDEKVDVTTIANHRSYDSYGNLKSETNAAVDCLLGFTGRPFDSTVELQHDGGQVYDATTGKRLGNDPRGFLSGKTNLSNPAAVRSTTTTAADQPSVDTAKIEASIQIIDVADAPIRMLMTETTWNEQEVLYVLWKFDPRVYKLWADLGHIDGGADEGAWFWGGPEITYIWRDGGAHIRSLTATVPDDWSSLKVAVFIMQELRDNPAMKTALDDYHSATPLAGDMRVLVARKDAFEQVRSQIATALKTITEVTVAVMPGGMFVVSMNEAFEGNYAAATIGMATILPIGKIANAVALEIKFTDGAVPVSKETVQAIKGMSVAERATLDAELKAATTVAKAKTVLAKIVKISDRSCQKIFGKHGVDFGLLGNWNPTRAEEVRQAIKSFLSSPSVRRIAGTYRGMTVTHVVDPQTGLNVILDATNNVIGGWKLGPAQLRSVLTTGRLF